MTDFLGDLLAELTGTSTRRFATWLDALQAAAPEYAHDIATEQQACERWAEMAYSVLCVTTDPHTRGLAEDTLTQLGLPLHERTDHTDLMDPDDLMDEAVHCGHP